VQQLIDKLPLTKNTEAPPHAANNNPFFTNNSKNSNPFSSSHAALNTNPFSSTAPTTKQDKLTPTTLTSLPNAATHKLGPLPTLAPIGAKKKIYRG